MNKKIITGVLVFIIFALALFLRVYFSWDTVFSDPIKYSADDGVYHMRLVENQLLGGHFPWRINFDPFTNFPNGTYMYFAPLYDFLLSLIIWIISFGKPTLEIINKVAPFYPAVIGSLVVFLVYFISHKIFNRPVAVLSSLLIAIMPSFLHRSILGNTDHHVAEVFFSTLTIMFLVYLVYGRHEQELKIVIKDKRFWIFTILTGISLGLYFLTWAGALLFLFIIFCFVFLYYLIKYLYGKNEEWILLSGSVIFVIAFLMVLPFFDYQNFFNGRIYNIQHFICFIGGILTFLITGILGSYLKKANKKTYLLPVLLLAVALFSIFSIKFLIPSIWTAIMGIITKVNLGVTGNKFAREMISEMSPTTISGMFDLFSALFFLSIISFCIFIYKFVKERKPEIFLIIVWTAIILFVSGIIPAFGQNRNNYYLSVIISILAGFIIVEGFKFGWQALRKAQDFDKGSYLRFYFYVSSSVVIFAIIFFSLYPFPFNIDNGYPSSLPDLIRSVTGVIGGPGTTSDDWYDTLKWLREKTPDPGVDYYALYKDPGIDKKTGDIEPYNYPKEAYGILAQWSVGHLITYYSHRMPVANPFQEGIGYINNDGSVIPGEGTFFLETNENRAIGYLDKLKAKYVLIDGTLANPNGIFKTYVKWINGNMDEYTNEETSSTEPTKFDSAMSTRLYFLDGSASSISKSVENKNINLLIPSLSHFRLLNESKNDASIFLGKDYKTTKQVKVFEYVKGAVIKGYTLPGQEVEISTNIKTNQGREFVYRQTVKSVNGSFEFVVPYSTGNQEKSDISASEYTVKIGNYIQKVNVLEDKVLEGKIINI